jgi:hypothetical protein
MRFIKGNKVEVLRNKEVPPGEWRCGKIISGNGHTYSVIYEDPFGMRSEALVERVPRKTIRPCSCGKCGELGSWRCCGGV